MVKDKFIEALRTFFLEPCELAEASVDLRCCLGGIFPAEKAASTSEGVLLVGIIAHLLPTRLTCDVQA
jgi:hypothetical protein